jgi:hypothetical protein
MKGPQPPATPKAREIATIERINEIIHSRIIPDGNSTNEFGDAILTASRVQTTVNFLQSIFREFGTESPWGNQSQNESALSEINEHTDLLLSALKALPPGVAYLLFIWKKEDLFEHMLEYRRAARHYSDFIEQLQELRSRVEALRVAPGEHESTKFQHKLVAFCAADLLRFHSIKPTRGNEAKPSTFEEVATALYEATTGNFDTDRSLIRACRGMTRKKFVL